jgi:hypothetical protein
MAERSNLLLALWWLSLRMYWMRVASSGLIPNTLIKVADWLSEWHDLLIGKAWEGWRERFEQGGVNLGIVNPPHRPERNQVLTSSAEGYLGYLDKNEVVYFHQIGDQASQVQLYLKGGAVG